MNALLISIKYHISGIRWISIQVAKGKYLFYFLPGLLLSIVFWFLSSWTSSFENSQVFDQNNGLYGFFNSTVKGSFQVLDFLFEQVKIFFLLTLLSPLFTWLSEKVDESLTGKTARFDLLQIIAELFRMVGIVLMSLLIQGLLLILFKIITGIFPLEFLNQSFAFLIAAFFYGFSFYDYSLERYQIGIFMSLSFARRKAMLNLVTGICFSALTLLPVIGLAVAPVIATILATYVFLAENDKIK